MLPGRARFEVSSARPYNNRMPAYRPSISSAAAEAKTGKPLETWFRLLDKAKAHAWPHKEIAAWLQNAHALSGWWSQTVTVEYERARGLREVHQKSDGRFAASASRTLPVPAAALYAAWNDARLRRKWLGSVKLTVRTAAENRSMRITWPDGSSVNVHFWEKGPAKSQVAIEHGKLPDAPAVARAKAHWKEALGRLAALLLPQP